MTVSGGGAPSSVEGRGLYRPDDWGVNWAAKLALAGSQLVKVAICGDSIGRGYFSSNLDAKGWAGLLRVALQTAYGDGGSGFKGVGDSQTWATAKSIPSAARTAYVSKGNYLTATGSWTVYAGTAGTFGPGGTGLAAGATTDTVTATVRGTTAKVFFLDTSNPFSVTIDGSAPSSGVTVSSGSYAAGTVTPGGTTAVNQLTVTGLAAGNHTIVITASGWTTLLVIYGVAGENATGVVLNNFGLYGDRSAGYANADTLRQGAWCGGWRYPADLVIYAMGANDAAGNVAADTWLANTQGYLSGVLDTYIGSASMATAGDTQNGSVDVLLLMPHIGGFDAQKLYSQYQARFRGLAQGYGAALVDMSAVGRRSWQNWKNAGYWAVTDGTGGSGSDTVHPSDAGHMAYYNAILACAPLGV